MHHKARKEKGSKPSKLNKKAHQNSDLGREKQEEGKKQSIKKVMRLLGRAHLHARIRIQVLLANNRSASAL